MGAAASRHSGDAHTHGHNKASTIEMPHELSRYYEVSLTRDGNSKDGKDTKDSTKDNAKDNAKDITKDNTKDNTKDGKAITASKDSKDSKDRAARAPAGIRVPFRKNKDAKRLVLPRPLRLHTLGQNELLELDFVVRSSVMRVYFPVFGDQHYIRREFRRQGGFPAKRVLAAVHSTAASAATWIIRDTYGPNVPILKSYVEFVLSQVVVTGFELSRDQVYVLYDVYEPPSRPSR
jgi:hypothetical protein